jgi:hypothetical protein
LCTFGSRENIKKEESRMKRMHVHVSVPDLGQSVRFYSTLFAAAPTVQKSDYAKWMLEDPRLNFAISERSDTTGIQHLGIQAENESELAEVYERLSRAEAPIVEEKATTCCYAKSDKQWVNDPQGIAWETFLTHGESTVYGAERPAIPVKEAANCCEPKAAVTGGCCAA